ncbi:anti-sigma factor family protein [Actinocrispum wychmicini]|uniref:Putative zinc finger protein n=1 Tax=Actinocrispum wychmicini TaxID=1213861 RepID=A0A4R2JMI2_9PSEU|nr:zf-HC2 domain-containing protein [Actinocrispum wychmicini]TCO58308.1 putative zinc finger protein [Actinocrispum wychmicini]
MNCDEFVELVTAFLDGTLDPDTEARFVEHISLCEGCERYLDQFRVTIAELGQLPPHSLTPQARDNLLTAFRDWHQRGQG